MEKNRSFLRKNSSHLVLSIALLMGFSLLAPGLVKTDQNGTNIWNQSSGLVVDLGNRRAVPFRLGIRLAEQSIASAVDLVDAGGGEYKIVAQNGRKCLDVHSFSKDDGARIILWDCHGGANQLWEFVDIGDPKSCPPTGGCAENSVGYLLVSKNSGKCLDAGNAEFPSPPKQGAPLQQWTCVRSTADPWWVNQAWRLGANDPPAIPPMPSDAKQIVDQIVQKRRDEGKCTNPSVRLDPRLSEVARNHSKDLADNYATLIDPYPQNDPKRGHIGSDGTMPSDRIKAQGFTPAQRPENWSLGTDQTYAQAMHNWLYDDAASNWGHQKAILDCNYRVLGVGTAIGHNSRVYWTQNFALG